MSRPRSDAAPKRKPEAVYRAAAIAFGLLSIGLTAFVVVMLR